MKVRQAVDSYVRMVRQRIPELTRTFWNPAVPYQRARERVRLRSQTASTINLKLIFTFFPIRLWNANVAGGLRGAAYAGAIGIPGLWALQRYSPRFRAVPLTVTALGVVVATFPFISVGAEKAGEAYQQSLWTGVGLKELTVEQQRAEDRWEHLTTSEKVKDWAGKQQYRLVGGR
jgi:hypothetical protein